MDAILAIAKTHSLPVIEDAAHAFPANIGDARLALLAISLPLVSMPQRLCRQARVVCSLLANPEYAERAAMMALHGISRDAWKRYSAEGSWYYEVLHAGYKYNMTDIAAAIGLHQLSRSEWLLQRRKTIAQRYTEAFSRWPELETPPDPAHVEHAWHLYLLRLHLERLTITRNEFIQVLTKANIGSSVHFIPLHLHPFYRDTYQLEAENFPAALQAYQRAISLPIYPGMTDQDVEDVIAAIEQIIEVHKR